MVHNKLVRTWDWHYLEGGIQDKEMGCTIFAYELVQDSTISMRGIWDSDRFLTRCGVFYLSEI